LQMVVHYKRTRVLGDTILPKLRKLSKGELNHWIDRDLGNILDMAVETQLKKGEVELWWEDDFAYGICLNKVIRVDEHLPAATLDPIYVIVRRASRDDADMIISVLNQETYDKSIEERRWTEEKPEKSKYKHPDDPPEQEEDVEIPDGVIEAVKQNAKEEPIKGECVLIEYTTANDPETHFVSTVKSGITQVSLALIGNGADPNSIHIWKTRMRVSFSTTLEE